MEISRVACEGDECNCASCKQVTLPGLVPIEPVQRALPGIPCAMPSHKRFAANGKQVLMDGGHYGDMIDENAATCAADALNGAEEQASWSTIVAQIK
jgi:hypothetical protein